jgi:hypothetical protein
LRERYEDDPSTHPDFDLDLWMDVGSAGGTDKNRVYGLSNIMVENLRLPVVLNRWELSISIEHPV